MYLSQLELLCEVVRVKSFSKAAKLLNLGEFFLRNQIAAVENYYGVQIFERDTGEVVLTEIGEEVVRHAREIIKMHNALEKKIDSYQEAENNRIIIGASHTVSNYVLPCILWNFQEKYPLTRVDMQVHHSQTVLSLLKKGKIHLAVVEEDAVIEDMDKYVIYPVSDDELLVIAPYELPWIGKNSISWEELSKAALIVPCEGSGIRRVFENTLNSKGIALNQLVVKKEVDSMNALKMAVEAGVGLAICTRIAVGKEIHTRRLHPLRIEGEAIKFHYVLIYRDDSVLNSAGKRFIRMLMDSGSPPSCRLSGSHKEIF
ncbi:transcriptional regulator, LysR family [Thermincola ferriacetica]|uniref:Transcriptional regulator, LysR family n=1 Tax=Thermincola ferriacetica TaxID=281456 RepID=A0A0L6W0W8_9FIRM|nr:LysR family transcriptional regulator [Thermincola ferriacetica]KNZ69111.1 transcriptional regulator, LysR family [Thermincola ferriacetica]